MNSEPTYTAMTHVTSVSAAGIDRESTYRINLPFTRSVFGCKAMTNEGSAAMSISKIIMLLVLKK